MPTEIRVLWIEKKLRVHRYFGVNTGIARAKPLGSIVNPTYRNRWKYSIGWKHILKMSQYFTKKSRKVKIIIIKQRKFLSYYMLAVFSLCHTKPHVLFDKPLQQPTGPFSTDASGVILVPTCWYLKRPTSKAGSSEFGHWEGVPRCRMSLGDLGSPWLWLLLTSRDDPPSSWFENSTWKCGSYSHSGFCPCYVR